ncbi:MAG: 4,5-DOPA dioxygenase extradiol [Acidimicrobiales bacterium]
MPAAFIGHGNPMNAIEDNAYTEAWRAFGQSIPRPRAVLCLSAHWYINATAVTAMARPRTIHDFYGFPRELFTVQYPAPGLPELAEEIREVVKPTWVGDDADSWGLDHGTWSVLIHLFPDASVPVVQVSINAEKGLDYHFELGQKLAPLREHGILIIGSGNLVHNLGAMNWTHPDGGYDWAERFDEAARDLLLTDPGGVPRLGAHPDYRKAVPTPDHFLPMVHFAGLASAGTEPVAVLADGCTYGSISMAAYTVGISLPTQTGGGASPGPTEVPPDDSNI